jgi:hypothetical protein
VLLVVFVVMDMLEIMRGCASYQIAVRVQTHQGSVKVVENLHEILVRCILKIYLIL